jgi:hypothetical protein
MIDPASDPLADFATTRLDSSAPRSAELDLLERAGSGFRLRDPDPTATTPGVDVPETPERRAA